MTNPSTTPATTLLDAAEAALLDTGSADAAPPAGMPDLAQLRALHPAAAVAHPFAALCRDGKLTEASGTFWADDIVSVEPFPGPYAVLRGRDAVRGKVAYWTQDNTIHSVAVEGPFINGDQFALRFSLDCTTNSTGQRGVQHETALYTVRDGRIVEERFFGMF
jgi:ketosteroid isomerase-like protein